MVSVLDCTLRDGGYYNAWDFEKPTVCKYLAAIATAKIDVVEIGFRYLPRKIFLGPFAYCTDEYLKTLPIPDSVDVAVMVNASELIQYDGGPEKAIPVLFSEKNQSPVDIVRIATHSSKVEECYIIAKILQGLGYQVFLNMMQVDSLDLNEVSRLCRVVEEWNCIEVLYFADSFGNMDSESVALMVSAIRLEWDGSIGIHTHDNKGYALHNSISAIDKDVNFIDTTLLGMGRGAGNAKTENLLVEIVDRGLGEYYPDALFPLVMQDFRILHEKYKWGPNIYYFLSAVHGIHPTYIQEMVGDERYGTDQILSAINFLKSKGASFFSFEGMLRAMAGMTGSEYGEWSAKDWAKGREVLIIGSGPSAKRYINDLKLYVERRNPIVLCLNINESVPQDMITAYVACHETRILIESDNYSDLGKPIILPLSRVPAEIKASIQSAEVMDYGLRTEEKCFEIGENGCVLSSPLALIYAISVVTAGGAEKILLTGVDGYESSDPRQHEMVKIQRQYAELSSAVPIYAITPTTYPVEQRSVYEPDV